MDLNEIRKYMREVPFGNSVFQIKKFTPGEETPERRVRNNLLQIHQKLQAMQECKFRRDEIYVDLDEIDEKLKNPDINKYEKRKLTIDKERKEFNLEAELKFIEDAEIEIAAYMQELETLPHVTREKFEQAELGYWIKRLVNDAQLEYKSGHRIEKGTLKSLNEIGIYDLQFLPDGQIKYVATKEVTKLIEQQEQEPIKIDFK